LRPYLFNREGIYNAVSSAKGREEEEKKENDINGKYRYGALHDG
jgi:hypothetical protein